MFAQSVAAAERHPSFDAEVAEVIRRRLPVIWSGTHDAPVFEAVEFDADFDVFRSDMSDLAGSLRLIVSTMDSAFKAHLLAGQQMSQDPEVSRVYTVRTIYEQLRRQVEAAAMVLRVITTDGEEATAEVGIETGEIIENTLRAHELMRTSR